MLVQTINSGSELHKIFKAYNRENQFTVEGLDALIDLFNEVSEDPIELDVIALCCEYAEDTEEQVLKDYNLESFDELCDNTWAVRLNNGNVIYQQF